jgi:hypothetical protein
VRRFERPGGAERPLPSTGWPFRFTPWRVRLHEARSLPRRDTPHGDAATALRAAPKRSIRDHLTPPRACARALEQPPCRGRAHFRRTSRSTRPTARGGSSWPFSMARSIRGNHRNLRGAERLSPRCSSTTDAPSGRPGAATVTDP